MKNIITWFAKGFGIGAANVIPGVSGGTIALITGIFERLIDSIKSFNIQALKLLLKREFKQFAKETDLSFLISIFIGAIVSIFTIAKLLGFLFEFYPIYVWAFFFGLILASVFFVGKTINKFSYREIIAFLIGTSIALYLSFMQPATENNAFYYLIICGIVGIVSMILPGLSGSFVLILMGNYELVMIKAVNTLDFNILIPVGIGIIIGLPAFSHILSWIYKKFRNQTIATLTGFILGSLSILWPWKNEVYMKDASGYISNRHGNKIIEGYERYIPDSLNTEVLLATALILTGILSIWTIERFANKK